MITRANIRRQLRASGGITNAVPRQQYGLGSFVKKALGKVTNVAKQVVKSPLGKAAILGLGASYLGPKIMGWVVVWWWFKSKIIWQYGFR